MLILLIVFPSGVFSQTKGASNAELSALRTVTAEIESVRAGNSEYANTLGKHTDFDTELLKVLNNSQGVGTPKTMFVEDTPVKIMVPLNLSGNRVGGFFQLSTDGNTILSYLIWCKNMEPLFIVCRQKWESATRAEEIEEIRELVPDGLDHTPGVPVKLSDLTDVYIIDYLDYIPSKTQEEREAYTKTAGLGSALGRRTGSSKCLAYAATFASDWWNIAQGYSLGKYDSFINGSRQYGMNPRALESLYYASDKAPYAFVKATGKDRVTGEKIPYSPIMYAYLMSSTELPKSVQDPIRPNISYGFPPNGFGMDLPYMNSFSRSQGRVDQIRYDLQRYGIMYAQHTSRLLGSRISNRLHGVHAVCIVGTAKLEGRPVVLYYESFGKNHRDYLEDSFYGPALRAFPVRFFYQGIVFPHRIIPHVSIENNSAVITFTTHENRRIAPESLKITVNGRQIKGQPSSRVTVPLGKDTNAKLRLEFSRRYFYTPEEPNGYVRNYLISNQQVIELNQYESVLKTIRERRGGAVRRMFRRGDSYTDHLTELSKELEEQLKNEIAGIRGNSSLIQMAANEVENSDILRRSEIGRYINAIMRYENRK